MYLFIATHLGSGASILCESLSSHRLCAWSRRSPYQNGLGVMKMSEGLDAKVYFDKLTHNHQFCCPSLYNQCRFIYVIRKPETSIAHIVNKGYSLSCAQNYYSFRLRRLCEMYKKTSGLLLVNDEVFDGCSFASVQEYLGFRDQITSTFRSDKFIDDKIDVSRAAYDRYLGLMSPHLNV